MTVSEFKFWSFWLQNPCCYLLHWMWKALRLLQFGTLFCKPRAFFDQRKGIDFIARDIKANQNLFYRWRNLDLRFQNILVIVLKPIPNSLICDLFFRLYQPGNLQYKLNIRLVKVCLKKMENHLESCLGLSWGTRIE